MIRHLPARVHGRYLFEAPSGSGPHPLLVGFHGYGENAAIHLDCLRRTVAGQPWALASVQALHPFYTRGDRDVVASWMTREDRELAIADNLAYVQAAVDDIGRELQVAAIVFAGFSQGAAMAYRAAAQVVPRADALIVLAGDVPPDVVQIAARLPPVLIGRGEADAWYTQEKSEADIQRLRAAGVTFELAVFDGGHEWADTFAAHARSFLAAVQAGIAGGQGLQVEPRFA